MSMTSRKPEKSSPSSSASASFWKTSSLHAVPGHGRPSRNTAASFSPKEASVMSVTSGSSTLAAAAAAAAVPTAAAANFDCFDRSVSDAWAIREDEIPSEMQTPPNVRTTSAMRAAVNGAWSRPDPATSLQRKGSKDDFAPGANSDEQRKRSVKDEKLENFFAQAFDMEALRQISWSGLTPKFRSKAWKILCGYLPGSVGSRQEEIVQRKQDEYRQYVQQYFHTKDQDIHQETYRQIHIDIPRMSPVIGLFQQRCVQEIFERILYIWAIRHPASGYVQGINDLVTPFFLVFLQDYCSSASSVLDVSDIIVDKTFTPEQITAIEADSFWCLTKVLDGIQDNYTFAQPGIQLKVRQLEELVQRVDSQLHNHLVSHEVMYLQFAFRWMNNILMREIPIRATIRLWDTYLSELSGFSHFHLYVCAAFLIHWKAELMKRTDFHTILMFLQNLPTAKWDDNDINLLVAEAFRLSYLFADAPSHFTSLKSTAGVNSSS